LQSLHCLLNTTCLNCRGHWQPSQNVVFNIQDQTSSVQFLPATGFGNMCLVIRHFAFSKKNPINRDNLDSWSMERRTVQCPMCSITASCIACKQKIVKIFMAAREIRAAKFRLICGKRVFYFLQIAI
jgi:hypothetical protein